MSDTKTVPEVIDDEVEAPKPVHMMDAFVEGTPMPPNDGELIEGTVAAIGRARVYFDLPPFGTGLIY